jgi:RimJ/RimL family protein N-acetyltransferase
MRRRLFAHAVAGDYARASLEEGTPVGIVLGDDAAAWGPLGARPRLIVVGAPTTAPSLAVEWVERYSAPTGISVERALLELLPGDLRPRSTESWDWMLTDEAPPPRSGESGVEGLDISVDAVRHEVQSLLDLASPEHWAPPGHPWTRSWLGVRDEHGRLVCVVAETRPVPDVPHLASVATHPAARGRGLARDAVGAMTRRLLAQGAPRVTLGMHATNDAARRVYRDLGFRLRHEWASGSLDPTSRSGSG